MIKFKFIINHSFGSYSTPPITVPKSQVDYSELTQKGYGSGNLTFVFLRGEKVGGQIYHAQAGFGPNYQLRTYTEKEIPKYLEKRDKLLIILVKDSRSKYAILEYRD